MSRLNHDDADESVPCYFCSDAFAIGVADDGTPTCGGEDCEPVDPDFHGEDEPSSEVTS